MKVKKLSFIIGKVAGTITLSENKQTQIQMQHQQQYGKYTFDGHLYFAGLVGGCRDGAGVKEGSERARP